jgi:acetylornithine deacetylase/succinyl-diaminopimelate desuccinylase-like protein
MSFILSWYLVRPVFGLLILSVVTAPAQTDNAARVLAHDILQQLIGINTTDSAGDNTAAARAMAKRFLDAGFPSADVQVLWPEGRPKKGNLVVRLHGPANGALKPILILGHLDVVEARREDWTTDPFQLVEKDGYFYGRGTQDMKSQDALLITTFIRLHQEHYQPGRDLILALTSDEEGGTANGVDWLLKNHRNLIDAEFVLNADAGGVDTDKGKPVAVRVSATEKLYADFQLTATNPGGHSSRPVPDNAIYHLADALGRLEHSPFPFELNAVTREYFKSINYFKGLDMDAAAMQSASADPFYNAMLHTTCVATRLNAGHANNALPQTAQAVVNCRILPGHSPEEIRRELIRKLDDPKVAVGYIDTLTDKVSDMAPDHAGPAPSAPLPAVMRPLEKVADQLWPGAPVVVGMSAGASDSKYTLAAGMPSLGIGEVAIDRDDDRAHGKDERLRVSSFYEAENFFYQFLRAIGS